jgi:hypothetical protein
MEVAVMDDGRIVHTGTMAELAADKTLQTRLLGFINLGRVSPALFVDAGMVWTGASWDEAIRRTGTRGNALAKWNPEVLGKNPGTVRVGMAPPIQTKRPAANAKPPVASTIPDIHITSRRPIRSISARSWSPSRARSSFVAGSVYPPRGRWAIKTPASSLPSTSSSLR